jgi:uncharacterized protein
MIPDEIRNSQGERLAFTFVPGSPEIRELVVIGHGLTSDKERPYSEALSSRLQERGIPSLRIAWSGNGNSEGRFQDSTISKEVEDLGSVLDALPGWNISYVGHSMGGAVGLLRAAQDPRIRALVSLAAITHSAAFFERLFGDLPIGEPLLEKPHCPLGEALGADMRAIGSTLSSARSLKTPWLIVHGELDDVVLVQDSIDLHAVAPEQAELVLLKGVDHSFTEEGLAQMLDSVLPWLAKTLG